MLTRATRGFVAAIAFTPWLPGCASGCGASSTARDPVDGATVREEVLPTPFASGFRPVGLDAGRDADLVSPRPRMWPAGQLRAEPMVGGAPLPVAFTFELAPGHRGVSLEWDFGDGHFLVGGAVHRHTYRYPGTYRVEVTATNEWGRASAHAEIVVETEAFEVRIDADVDAGSAPLSVRFDVQMFAPIPGPLRYEWDFGDGHRSKESAPRHTYRVPGDYIASLTVTSPSGQVGRDAFEINVESRLRR